MGNGSHARVLSVGTVILKFTSRKTVLLKNVEHVPSIKKNLVSGSLLCQDGYKLVFGSNKCILSKYGTFDGKGYDSGGLFRLSLHDVCNKSVNNVISNELYIWHSRLCHNNIGCLSRLANLNLIPKFDLVRGSKCQVCVQSKQPHKPHKAAEARNSAPIDLIHSDLCEILLYFVMCIS
jgi:hypothetical protein